MDLVGCLMSRLQVMELFATTAWHIWLHRNKTRLGEHTVPLGMIRDAACKFLQIFQQRCDYSCSSKPMEQCLMKVKRQGLVLWCATHLDRS